MRDELSLPETFLLVGLYGANGRWWPPRDRRFDRALAESVHAEDPAAPSSDPRECEERVAASLAQRKIVEATLEPVLPFLLRREYVLLAAHARRRVVNDLRDAVLQHAPVPDRLAALALLVDDAVLWSHVVPGHERRLARWRASELRVEGPRGPLTRRLAEARRALVA